MITLANMDNKLMDELGEALGVKKNGEIMQKAADPFTSSQLDSTGTSKEVATAFINLVVNESVLLGLVRVHRTMNPSGDLTKLSISGYVSEQASENSAATETRRPTNTGLSYTNKKLRSSMDWTGETGEDNIEGTTGRETVLRAMVDAMANDIEVLAIEGDESQAGTDDYSRLVKTNDGFNVLTAVGTGTHIFDAGETRVSIRLLSQMLKTMPNKWKRNKAQLRFIMSPDVLQDLRDEVGTRATGLGDANITGEALPKMHGISIVEVPLIPENLALSGTDSTGTFIWLTRPGNFVYVVQRELLVEWERVPRSDRWEMTAHSRHDFLVENTDAVVKATNVALDTGISRYS